MPVTASPRLFGAAGTRTAMPDATIAIRDLVLDEEVT
jgi:hypothetical protein